MSILESKQLINDSKNIYLIPGEEPAAIACTLALFYTLKEMGKNVNLILEKIPENLQFLAPSLDFISYPKNFVISIPNSIAGVSQIYYEKNDEALKIHLTIEKGSVKKDNISFYYSETKPDLIITIGVQNYSEQLKTKLNSFGFLLDSPILNIDNVKDNRNFGKINIIEEGKSLTEIISTLLEIKNKEAAKCFLTELVLYTENFKKNITAYIFETAGILMKNGTDFEEIMNHIK